MGPRPEYAARDTKDENMFDIKRKTIDWAGRPLTLETGRIARQADGAVLATYGETIVLATVVYGRAPKPGLDFFPLTVNYQEKTFAAGKIPGGYFKREGRPTEKETLVSRLIDRPIRPLFVKGFKNETQVVITVLQHDLENDPDIVGMVATSAALTLSGVPFMGPIGAARVGYIDGEFVLNPTLDQMPDSQLDLVVAGTSDALMMVESEAKELSEQVMLDALMFAHRGMQPVIDAIIEMAEHAAKDPFDFQAEDHSGVVTQIQSLVGEDIKAAYTHPGKHARHEAVGAAKKKASAALVKTDENPDGVDSAKFGVAWKECEAHVLRRDIIDNAHRVDGRALDKVRDIVSEVGIFPRTHGSALFTRGETQAIVVATLGTGEDEQYVELPGRDVQGEVPPALQLPSLLGRRDRSYGRRGPSGNRSRQAGLAGDPSDAADLGRIPLHDPHRVGDHRIQRFVLHGLGLRRLAGADGRGRAPEEARLGHRHGPDPGAVGRVRHPVRHPG
ncbi:Polyribonucleotide nucleotidyltransferase [Brevundimonas subvibrioides]